MRRWFWHLIRESVAAWKLRAKKVASCSKRDVLQQMPTLRKKILVIKLTFYHKDQ